MDEKSSVEQLKIESKRAADTLTELLDSQNPPAVRRAAANDILNYVLKFREHGSLLFEPYEEDHWSIWKKRRSASSKSSIKSSNSF